MKALFALKGLRRKVIHALLYELIAIVVVALLLHRGADKDLAQTGRFALATSVIAVSWNMLFNALFEAWERRQNNLHRSWQRRSMHALGFEGGLVLMTVPLLAWWLEMGWWPALLADLGLVAFFVVYTFVFNWVFDHVCSLP